MDTYIKRRNYKNNWNKKHRSEINKRSRVRRKLKRQYVKKLEKQVKLIPKLNHQVNKLKNELKNNRAKLKEQNKLNQFGTLMSRNRSLILKHLKGNENKYFNNGSSGK